VPVTSRPASVGSLRRFAASHRDAGYDSPTASDRVHRVMAGIRHAGDATVGMKWPLLTADIRHLIGTMSHNTWPAGAKAARDTAAILIGYASALRRSNVSALNVDDVTVTGHDLRLQVAGSKTDQHGVGLPLTVPFGKQPPPRTTPGCSEPRSQRTLPRHRCGRLVRVAARQSSQLPHLTAATTPERKDITHDPLHPPRLHNRCRLHRRNFALRLRPQP